MFQLLDLSVWITNGWKTEKKLTDFPEDYIIDRDIEGKPYPIKDQVSGIGNSVVPIMAQKLVEANCGYLKVGERMPNMRIDYSEPQLRFA